MGRGCLVILILALATTCSAARADVGLSYLGLCSKSWSCDASVKAFNGQRVIRVGWLEQTFGSKCPCAERLLKAHRPKEIRVHLTNGACLRNRRCGRYEAFYGETVVSANRKVIRGDERILKRFTKGVLRFKERLAKGQRVTCWVSPMLESDLDGRARAVLHSITSHHLPECRLVDSPHRRSCLKGITCERHGSAPILRSPCISDLDGVTVEQVSVRNYLRRTKECDLRFIWSRGLNCLPPEGDPFVDPRKRHCAHSEGYFRGLSRHLHGE